MGNKEKNISTFPSYLPYMKQVSQVINSWITKDKNKEEPDAMKGYHIKVTH